MVAIFGHVRRERTSEHVVDDRARTPYDGIVGVDTHG